MVVDVAGLAAVVVVFGVVVVAAGVCVDSVCASSIPAENKLQIRTMIERFIIHPFESIEVDKLPRPRQHYKKGERLWQDTATFP